MWTWDITWLPGPVKGLFFYLYLILDVYSRKIVGWEVYPRERSDHAAELVWRAVMAEGCVNKPLVLHADNGSPQKGSTLLAMLDSLGVQTSYSRPRVSNDNAYSEAAFRTCKYRPDYPGQGFKSLEETRQWVHRFVHWYNHEHRHSGIRFVTPHERHQGTDHQVLAQRLAVYQAARAKHPERWSRNIRCWEPVAEVWLNPEHPSHSMTSEAA